MELNQPAARLAAALAAAADRFRVAVLPRAGGGTVLDCGITAPGGLAAGLQLARICLADAATVQLLPARSIPAAGWEVAVQTDHPVAACLGSQYAGWQIKVDKFFALGSGPMRAAAGTEKLFETIGLRETPSAVVGALETSHQPPDAALAYIATQTRLPESQVTLCVAPTTSLAGMLQIVARSVETALHKLHELHFDLTSIVSAAGTAPLPPPTGNWLSAMGRTNDAILYGGEVTLWVRGDDDTLAQFGPRVPSCAAADFGQPFAELFERYDRDFYRIDPALFSPAVIRFINLDTGRTHRFGNLVPDLVHRSFGIG